MLKYTSLFFCLLFANLSPAQKLETLTVEKIMRDPKWIGASPSNPQWSYDGRTLYFNWNPEKAPADSLYFITLENLTPTKATAAQQQERITTGNVKYNNTRTAFVYTKESDVFFTDIKSGTTKRIVQTTDVESNPQFCFNETKIVFTRNQNLFAWDIRSGETIQLTNLISGSAKDSKEPALNAQEQWLKNDQLSYFEVLRSRKEKKDKSEAYTKALPKQKELRVIPMDDKTLQGLSISPDGRFISYRLFKAIPGKTTIVPSYVTESGFTTDIPGRTKVGATQGSNEFFIYDRVRDTVLSVKVDSTFAGIRDLPDYVKDYPKQLVERNKKPADRNVNISGPFWSPKGTYAVLEIRSQDNKDRWLALWDTATRSIKLLDRQRDESWIGGPGIFSFNNNNWLDEQTYYYQSEKTGYSHLYCVNVITGENKAITAGKFEVQQALLSNNKKYFYISTNEVHPGEQQYYRLPVTGGKAERITSMTGANDVAISPDEHKIAFLYSYSNKPWELYLQDTKTGAKPIQITQGAQSPEFASYQWKDPEIITFPARDGATVYGRLYKPVNPHPSKPAVVFVHGAGYLQNAHKWWSSYFREYMFHNLLADNGYYVIDIDYRGSAGYGRDWRTGIYRWMGGKDLSDNVDAAGYLVKNFGVDPKRIGLYGGSYGGFITLMAMFTAADTFAAGAALRPVTDWANYNHGYTSNILNEPATDSLAYRKSSPFYFADGLKGNLLICHGMLDVNVHFQDAVKLSQRLIELGKNDWELAAYPMEDHGFVEPSSWTDEYKRIFKLFERVLKK